MRFLVNGMNDASGTASIIHFLDPQNVSFIFRPLLSAFWAAIVLYPTQKLSLFRRKTFREGLFIQSTFIYIDWLPYRWVEPICVLNKNRVSLYARTCSLEKDILFSNILFL